MLPTTMTLPGFANTVPSEENSVEKTHTIGYIRDQMKYAKTFCDPWHGEITRWRRKYNFDHYDKKAKPGEVLYEDPSVTNLVDAAVGVLSSNDIEWRASSFTPTGDFEESTSRVEKYLIGVMEASIEREGYHIPFEVFMHGARDGAFVVRSVWDPVISGRSSRQMAMEDPNNLQTGVRMVRVFDEVPIRTEVIDPIEVYCVPGGPRRWRVIMRETSVSVLDAESTYSFVNKRTAHLNFTSKMQQLGTMIDYWAIDDSSGQPQIINAIVYENDFIPGFEPRIMEGYADIPYEIGFFKPVSRTDSKGWGHSIIKPVETSLHLLESSVNRRMQQINTFTGLPMVITAMPGRDTDIDPGFGNSIVISPDESIAFPMWPGNPPDVDKHINLMETRIQQSGLADLTLNAASQATGFALSQLSDQNSIRLQQPIKQFEMFWSNWARKILRLTKSFAAESVVRV